MRFITGKYAANLDSGGMIGYVMDGETSLAVQAIKRAVEKHRGKLKLFPGEAFERSPLFPCQRSIRETKHGRNDRTFTIYHVFLPV